MDGQRVHLVAQAEEAQEVCADLQDRGDDAQRVEQPARPAVLTVHLPQAVLLGDAPVLLPEPEAVAHLDGDDAEVRAPQGLGPLGGGGDGEGQALLAGEAARRRGHGGQGFGLDVVQRHLAPPERRTLEDVTQHAQPELRAPGADQCDLHRAGL
jgi:hypothetical protein